MSQLQFNLNVDSLKDSIMKSNLEDVVKATVVLVLNEFMEKERDEHLQAGAYERTPGRIDYRNGYYDRELLMSIGQVKLRVPRTRNGDFSTTIFEKYARCDQAFVLAMLEMVVNGVSTRKVKNIVKELCGKDVSKSFVSSLTEKLDPIVNQWANRPLNTLNLPYLFVDAMYIKVRERDHVVSKAVYIATAINKENGREVLGLKVDHGESHESWKSFFQHLQSRGLQSPKLVISDAHKGLQKAIREEFIGTSWQRCTVHFKRNLFSHLPKKGTEEVKMNLKRIFQVAKPEEARKLKEEFVERYGSDSKMEKTVAMLEEGFEDAIQYLNEDYFYHPFIRSTNSLERLNQEVRRRERVIRIFPNTQSAFRLVGAVLMQYEEEQMDRKLLIKRK